MEVAAGCVGISLSYWPDCKWSSNEAMMRQAAWDSEAEDAKAVEPRHVSSAVECGLKKRMVG